MKNNSNNSDREKTEMETNSTKLVTVEISIYRDCGGILILTLLLKISKMLLMKYHLKSIELVT